MARAVLTDGRPKRILVVYIASKVSHESGNHGSHRGKGAHAYLFALGELSIRDGGKENTWRVSFWEAEFLWRKETTLRIIWRNSRMPFASRDTSLGEDSRNVSASLPLQLYRR